MIGLSLSTAVPVAAHDFWIEPSTFTPEPASRLSLRLKVGERFVGEPVRLDPGRVARFVVDDGAGPRPVAGVAGRDPAGLLRIERPGVHAVGYESRPASIELDAELFEAYLVEEGLAQITALRAARGETGTPGREAYSRSAKSLLSAGGGTAGRPDRRLGLPLELLVEDDPTAEGSPSELPMRLLFHGQPLAGALVVAMPEAEPSAAHSARTDAGGRVTLAVDRPGAWLVKSVHMEPADGIESDWRSWWASLTFMASGR